MEWASEGYVLSVKKHGETSAIIDVLTRRLSEYLGTFKVEALTSRAAELMEDRLMLSAINAMTAMAKETLPEREVHERVYDAFEILLSNLDSPDIWPVLYVQWEAGLLQALGYGLDLSACAATGANDQLTHVSPRSGRAVSASAAEPYLDKLFALPQFMMGAPFAMAEDIANGLSLTGYFLETRLQWGVNRTLPAARAQMIEQLVLQGHASRLPPR